MQKTVLVPLFLLLLHWGCNPARPTAEIEETAASSPAAPAAQDAFPKAEGYKGIWFTLNQFSEFGDKYSGGLGTYTANHLPIAIYSEKADKTFFLYGGTTRPEEKHLLIMASYYDHKQNQVPQPTIVHDKMGVDDPHDNGSLTIDDQGYLWVFVSGRGRTRPGFKYRSREPYSVEAFDLLWEGEMTYCQPWFVPGKGFIHFFTKYTKGRELYFETSPDGRTWSETKKLAGLGGHYQVTSLHQAKIGTFFNYHPGGDVDKRTNLYYMQTTDMGQTWTTVDGKPLTLPLTEVQNPALVVDYEARGQLQYHMDLSWDRNGHPVMLYLNSRHHQPGPQGGPREWKITKWTGSSWETYPITSSDHNYDMGSLYIGQDLWRVIGPTDVGPQAHQTGGEMVSWVSRDEGRTWQREKQITTGSPRNHAYARRPLPAKDPFYTFWADGNPKDFSQSRLYFGDSKGNYWELPYQMQTPFVKLGQGE
jgi:hypothetical protein